MKKFVSVLLVLAVSFGIVFSFSEVSFAKNSVGKYFKVIEFVNGKLKMDFSKVEKKMKVVKKLKKRVFKKLKTIKPPVVKPKVVEPKVVEPEEPPKLELPGFEPPVVEVPAGPPVVESPVVEPVKPVEPQAPGVPVVGPVAPEAPETPVVVGSNYPWHYNITATTFWLGEEPSADNGYISNVPTAWEDPVADSENAWYVAVPYNDMEYVNGETRNKAEVVEIPWYDEGLRNGYEFYSFIKNRWVMVVKDGVTAYGQVEDAGPHGEDLFDYVIKGAPFYNPASSNNAGLDLSPALADYVGSGGRDEVNWKFVEEWEVPAGPWKKHIETQQCVWGQYGDVK